MSPTSSTHLTHDDLARMFKAMAHPARIRIIEHLKAIDQCICGEIVSIFPLSQSTVSQHLKSLKDAGLIRGEVEGPKTCYCINRETLNAFQNAVERLIKD